MRVGIEAQRIFRKGKHGMDFVAINYIKYLAQLDDITEIVVFAKQGVSTKELLLIKKIKFVFVPKLPYPIWEQILLPIYYKKENLDFLHCTSSTAPLYGINKLIVTIHDIIYLEKTPLEGGTLYQKLGKRYRRFIIPRAIKKANSLITVSEFERDCIIKTFPEIENKLHTVYNAANNSFYNENKQELSVKFPKELNNKSYILFLGNTDPKKNVKGLLLAYVKVLQSNINFPALFMPDYPKNWLIKWLKSNKVDKKYWDKIIVSGYLPNSELKFIMEKADFFVYPSFRESFGIPVLEAFLSRTLLVASKTGSIPEISHGHCIYIDPLDINSIGNGLIMANNISKSDKEKIIDNAYERALNFSWNKSAEQLLALYKNCN